METKAKKPKGLKDHQGSFSLLLQRSGDTMWEPAGTNQIIWTFRKATPEEKRKLREAFPVTPSSTSLNTIDSDCAHFSSAELKEGALQLPSPSLYQAWKASPTVMSGFIYKVTKGFMGKNKSLPSQYVLIEHPTEKSRDDAYQKTTPVDIRHPSLPAIASTTIKKIGKQHIAIRSRPWPWGKPKQPKMKTGSHGPNKNTQLPKTKKD